MQLFVRTTFVLLVSILFVFRLQAQDTTCRFQFSATVIDEGSLKPLSGVEVGFPELGTVQISDLNGRFIQGELCSGGYHIVLRHIGCDLKRIYVEIHGDTTIVLQMLHHEEALDKVVIQHNVQVQTAQSSSSVSQSDLSSKGGKNLGGLLEHLPGVWAVSNGQSIAKPIVHGLTGNRVAIVNNGLVQAGQQWGLDHAPEIDPFSSNQIKVLKGVGALKYGGNAMAGVVVVESNPIPNDPHIHGKSIYQYQSNGRVHTNYNQVERADSIWGWRVSSTYKNGGDLSTPTYFLNNTGVRELDATGMVHRLKGKSESSIYYSYFSSEIGILRGAHIGNLTDLNLAVKAEEPYYTEESFKRNISSPRQMVSHHLFKLEHEYELTDKQHVEFIAGYQINHRDEFDVRRSGKSEIPALSLTQHRFNSRITHYLHFAKTNVLESGVEFISTRNANNAGTGILPLIPNYKQIKLGSFVAWNRQIRRYRFEIGGRYDQSGNQIYAISTTLPRRVEHHQLTYHNFTSMIGLSARWRKHLLKFTAAQVQRAPEVNELFSNGLHQGLSGIERGDQNLQNEHSFKGVFGYDFQLKEKFVWSSSAYAHLINRYINLVPTGTNELTIRGAFPVYVYNQQDVVLKGVESHISFEPVEYLKFTSTYNAVKGVETSTQKAVFGIPNAQWINQLTFLFNHWTKFKNVEWNIEHAHHFKQSNFNLEQEIIAPPPAYHLFNTNLQFKLPSKKIDYKLILICNNVFNVEYRNYLNRLRYFSDEVGRTFNATVQFQF